MNDNFDEKKIDVETYWNKKRFTFNWSKLFLTCIYISFVLVIGIYSVDLYIKTHDLTFIKFKINPEFGFVVNGKDIVVYYIPLNDDAKAIYNLNMFKGKTRTEALSDAISVAKENNYLVEGEEKSISITVVSEEKDKVEKYQDKVIEDLKQTDKEIVSNVVEATEEEVKYFGKITVEDVKSESINKNTVNGVKPSTGVNGDGSGNTNTCSSYSNSDTSKCSYTNLKITDMSGPTRFDTAVNIAKKFSGNKYLVIVNSEDYVDGYLAAGLSATYNAPILTTNKDSIDKAVLDLIKEKKYQNIYIIGGTGVVSSKVEEDIREASSNNDKLVNIIRLNGKDRFDTSLKVANEIKKVKTVDSVLIVPNNGTMVDAGMVASVSSEFGIPMLISNTTELNSDIEKFILDNKTTIKNIYLVSGLFSDSVKKKANEIKDKLDAEKTSSEKGVVKIFSGKDRYKTNAAVVKYFYVDAGKTINSVSIVNNQIDLITVASFAALENSVLFYVNNEIDTDQINIIKKYNKYNTLYYFGGEEIKVAMRNMSYELKKANVSKCTNPTKELLYMNKHAVIYIPHQDDESSHLGQIITGAVERLGSNNVHLVVVTDGDGSAAKNDEGVKKILAEYGISFSQARDREFRASAQSLCVGDYKFVEELNLKNGKNKIVRMPDSGLVHNVSNLKTIMKYYDNKYKNDGGVTHFTYTNYDSHTDHNTLGSTLKSLYFDTKLDDNSFKDVYLAVKYLEYYEKGVSKKIPTKYVMEYSNPTSWPYMRSAFTKYQKNISDDGDKSNDLLGMGYASAEHVFVQFQHAMTKENEIEEPEDQKDYYPLTTPIHVPFN